ncbi:cobyrinate a,c-diamide synthase [Alphaproteobacteria bacterium LSUCC0684]
MPSPGPAPRGEMNSQNGLMIAGLSSGSGKTLISLGLMRALKKRGVDIRGAKAGPDYIDPGFHRVALGRDSVNLDPFAMAPPLLSALAAGQGGEFLMIEGVMGIHDGGNASSAALARALGVPIVLVMDISGQAETAAAVAAGIRDSLKPMGVALAGVIFNRCRSPRHRDMAASALLETGMALFGAVMEDKGMSVPSRHLGLVQAEDLNGAETIIRTAAEVMADQVDLDRIIAAGRPLRRDAENGGNPGIAIPPPGQRIAVARDRAFGFAYPHLLAGWQRAGAEVTPFSPLADETLPMGSDFVFLPGGYPELHLPELAAAKGFMESLRKAARKNIPIYGECGGYMVLGRSIIDADGTAVPMAGLLDCETSFARRRLSLGYRRLERLGGIPLPSHATAHEFHYTTAISEKGAPAFAARDRDNNDLGTMGLQKGSVFGSYAHLIAAP